MLKNYMEMKEKIEDIKEIGLLDSRCLKETLYVD